MPGLEWNDLSLDMQRLILNNSVLDAKDTAQIERTCKSWKNTISENPSRKFSFFFSKSTDINDVKEKGTWSYTNGNDNTSIYSSMSVANETSYLKAIKPKGFCEVNLTLSECKTKISSFTKNTFNYNGGFKTSSIVRHIDQTGKKTPNPLFKQESTASPTLSK